jgi:hypothetical protein
MPCRSLCSQQRRHGRRCGDASRPRPAAVQIGAYWAAVDSRRSSCRVRSHQRRGLGVAVVGRAIAEAQAAGCEWLFVDFEPALTPFYIEACGFRSTPAGLIHLPSWAATSRKVLRPNGRLRPPRRYEPKGTARSSAGPRLARGLHDSRSVPQRGQGQRLSGSTDLGLGESGEGCPSCQRPCTSR